MKTRLIIITIATSFALCAAQGEDKAAANEKSEVVSNGNTAKAEAVAEANSAVVSSSTTSINGKRVTTIVTKDKDGNERIKTITHSASGKPRVNDITDQLKKARPAANAARDGKPGSPNAAAPAPKPAAAESL
jgi:hypothetical protein